MRIVFMGTPDFAVGILEKLLQENKKVVGVITVPDKPAGRGRSLRPSAVKEFALKQNLPILQPVKLKDPEFLEALAAWKADLQVVVAFRMLPRVVWEMPPMGTFNLHASLLPEYRGAAPINWAIINGEDKTGVTTFFIDEQIDTGAIIASKDLDISANETAGTLHDKLMDIGSQLVVKTVALIEQGEAASRVQSKDKSFKEAPKLNSENTRIDWSKTPSEIDQFVRGLNPYPVAWTELVQGSDRLRMKIYEVIPEMGIHSKKIGTVEIGKKELKVAVKDGYVYIKVMQWPGKKKMAILDLLNGQLIEKQAVFM